MEQKKVFISVGGCANDQQENFVKLVEDRLRSENLIPSTVGRNNFSADSPLKAVKELMNECSGILVIALERTYFEKGIQKRGGAHQSDLSEIKFSTPWNQIESGMAYVKELPILVILEEGIRAEGLLEKGYDWYVMTLPLTQQSLATSEFNGVLASWKTKIGQFNTQKKQIVSSKLEPNQLTIGELVSSLKVSHFWGVLGAIVGLLVAMFAIGRYFPIK